MNLAKVIFFALFGGFAFVITMGFFGWIIKTSAFLLTVKAPGVRKRFAELIEPTGINHIDAVINLVVFLPIWLPSAMFAYWGVHVNPSFDEKVGSILGMLAMMVWIVHGSFYSKKI